MKLSQENLCLHMFVMCSSSSVEQQPLSALLEPFRGIQRGWGDGPKQDMAEKPVFAHREGASEALST